MTKFKVELYIYFNLYTANKPTSRRLVAESQIINGQCSSSLGNKMYTKQGCCPKIDTRFVLLFQTTALRKLNANMSYITIMNMCSFM